MNFNIFTQTPIFMEEGLGFVFEELWVYFGFDQVGNF